MKKNDETLQILKVARRCVDGFDFARIEKDWQFDENRDCWFLLLRFSLDVVSNDIPRQSYWYVCVQGEWRISVFPAKEGGMTSTFHHQNYNDWDGKSLWKNGRLCLDYNMLDAGNLLPSVFEDKFRFYITRAKEWIVSAASGTLVHKGEAFELPDFPMTSPRELDYQKFVFSENDQTFQTWKKIKHNCGTAIVRRCDNNVFVSFVYSFSSHEHGTVIHTVHWGNYPMYDKHDDKHDAIAIWIRLDEMPVLRNWEVPYSWGDLFSVLEKNNIDLNVFFELISFIRDGEPHFLLLGFPIPEVIGEEKRLIFWKAIHLNGLARKEDHEKGFRANELGRQVYDQKHALGTAAKINWIPSENWNPDEINQRGKFCNQLCGMKIIILGAGCIGSSIAEILARGGCREMVIVDGDTVEIGNMSRHVLGLSSIGLNKAQEVANRLTQINPNIVVTYVKQNIGFCGDKPTMDLSVYDVILDCTSSNDVLVGLSNQKFKVKAVVVIVSVDINASHLFMAIQRGEKCNFEAYTKKITPYLKQNNKIVDELKLPRNGTGCWSPTFPARYDSILFASSTSCMLVDSYVANECQEYQISIFEKKMRDDAFEGYEKVASND
ncbi:MAG: ThiF family adenylyltransferase [Sphaerochaetaceae bacterium]|jgi:hypothetical protein|nr:ThiF family adenylyltransferase [Bacteroidales bacterium]